MHLITGRTQLLGVIGAPVEHSLSPVMHNAAIAALGLDYIYVPLSVAVGDLPRAMAGFEAIALVGFNATIPHKQDLLPLLTEISPTARQVGAVNTVWRTATGWAGTNTDAAGFVAPLREHRDRDWQQVVPVILGNGGAARAVVVGCAQLGCRRVVVVGRNPDKLATFQASWQDVELSAKVDTCTWDVLPELLATTELLVHTTPVGMTPHPDRLPVDASTLARLQPGAIAYDLIYTPRPTRFLEVARGSGAIAIDGLEMLVQQGAASLELWLQQPVPVDIMRRALDDYLIEKT
ncbi:Shikimate 5-dehydrogenase [Rubidibacter lacunae KORDI 51-2]|uniref:Shikimate dehydrogenase (NADP(+)) n=1 Tax=Rubidibacter lacunae KORDI 51-2 TaxID=582515 RepID=U5DK24_9CHRO|nr:shikimate dehydrogenase [Rubidibacter lacunae]ERN42036.1 Shikimate 5-dehydrogenase [Rubidibacter lacunae KORDI 51-2]